MVKGDFKSSEAQADYGYVIKKYKEKIKKGNVILVVNLNDVSFSNVVKVYRVQHIFHIFPDTGRSFQSFSCYLRYSQSYS